MHRPPLPHIIPEEPSELKYSITKSQTPSTEEDRIITPSAPTRPSAALNPVLLSHKVLIVTSLRYSSTPPLRPSSTIKSFPAPESLYNVSIIKLFSKSPKVRKPHRNLRHGSQNFFNIPKIMYLCISKCCDYEKDCFFIVRNCLSFSFNFL